MKRYVNSVSREKQINFVRSFALTEQIKKLIKKYIKGKGKGTEYALNLVKNSLLKTSNNGKKDCYFLKIVDISATRK